MSAAVIFAITTSVGCVLGSWISGHPRAGVFSGLDPLEPETQEWWAFTPFHQT